MRYRNKTRSCFLGLYSSSTNKVSLYSREFPVILEKSNVICIHFKIRIECTNIIHVNALNEVTRNRCKSCGSSSCKCDSR